MLGQESNLAMPRFYFFFVFKIIKIPKTQIFIEISRVYEVHKAPFVQVKNLWTFTTLGKICYNELGVTWTVTTVDK